MCMKRAKETILEYVLLRVLTSNITRLNNRSYIKHHLKHMLILKFFKNLDIYLVM